MSREIKFRAWDKTRQIMFVPIGYSYIDGYLTCISEAKRTMQNDVTEHLDETWYEDYREPRYSDGKSEIILMQYTGLKDRIGKEIYEGDILKRNGEYDYEILWGKYGWSAKQLWSGNHRAIDEVKPESECKVIGSIYENPELLKESKK